MEAVREEIVPLATVLTPNLTELGPVAGVSCETVEDRELAAKILLDAGASWVLVKGGHDAGAVGGGRVARRGVRQEFSAPRADNRHTHGTGCTLASAIASYLARGYDVPAAVGAAKEYVSGAIAGRVRARWWDRAGGSRVEISKQEWQVNKSRPPVDGTV